MSSNNFEFCPDKKCDFCGAIGAIDLYGDYFCIDCFTKGTPTEDDLLDDVTEEEV